MLLRKCYCTATVQIKLSLSSEQEEVINRIKLFVQKMCTFSIFVILLLEEDAFQRRYKELYLTCFL